jgi:hypothetical protein
MIDEAGRTPLQEAEANKQGQAARIIRERAAR